MSNRSIMIAISIMVAQLASAEVIHGKLQLRNKAPVDSAEITVIENSISTSTNTLGEFQLDLPPGRYTLDIEAPNWGHQHHAIEVEKGINTPIVITLNPNQDRKLVIAANPLEHTRLDMATPTMVLSGDDLVLKRSATLGEMLQHQPGISVSSFGPAVARPVIRGLSGARVLITTNQMSSQDASTASADHDVVVEPLLAKQIEVLKGPASLLYGSGAIGGVVNITDNRINPEKTEVISGGLEARLGDSTSDERSVVLALNGGLSDWNWHIDHFDSQTQDLKIPAYAESARLLAQENESPQPGKHFVLENSAASTQGTGLGNTWIQDWGYLGVAWNQTEKQYGVPGHHHEADPITGDETENIKIDMEQSRWDAQIHVEKPFDGIQQWFAGYANTDYQHRELEGSAIGTTFTNQAQELRSFIRHRTLAGWEGITGLQWSKRDFAALGDEAIIPPSDTQTQALFLIEEKSYGPYKLELGIRFETQALSVAPYGKKESSAFSASAGTVILLNNTDKLAFNFALAERIPTVEERYSFGEHVATQTFERGQPDLDNETSRNLDISFRFERTGFYGEINAYSNRFSQFIFGNTVENTGTIDDLNGQPVVIETALPIIQYQQSDARISGLEAQLQIPLIDAEFDLELGLMADYISAELKSGEYLPRIPPIKTGVSLKYDYRDLTLDLQWQHSRAQRHISAHELATDGFDAVDLELAYRQSFPFSETLWFIKGKNLLDEEARDHTSFLKDLAPRSGRSFVMGVRHQF